MIFQALIALGLYAGATRLAKGHPRWQFVIELWLTLAIVYVNLAFDNAWLRVASLLAMPGQVHDLALSAGPAGVVCLLRRKHRPGKRMLVDAAGRPVGQLVCGNPDHDHGLPEGVMALPGTCRRCGRTAVG